MVTYQELTDLVLYI